MKKTTVFCFICGGVMLFLGGVTVILTSLFGATGYQGRFFNIGYRNGAFGIGNISEYVVSEVTKETAVASDSGTAYITSGTYSDGDTFGTAITQSFSRLSISTNISDVTLTQDGGDGYITAENIPSDKLYFNIASDTLVVKEQIDSIFPLNFGTSPSRSITINLPSDVKLERLEVTQGVGSFFADTFDIDELQLQAGVGEITLYSVSANKLDFHGNVGDLSLHNFICREDMNIEADVGSVDIDGTVGGNASFKSGVGSIVFDGSIDGDIDVKGDVGSVELMLVGNPNDYYYTIKKDISSITINGEDMGSNTKSWGNKDASHKVDLKGGIGSIDVNVEN